MASFHFTSTAAITGLQSTNQSWTGSISDGQELDLLALGFEEDLRAGNAIQVHVQRTTNFFLSGISYPGFNAATYFYGNLDLAQFLQSYRVTVSAEERNGNGDPSVVPEPSMYPVFAAGALGLLYAMRKRMA